MAIPLTSKTSKTAPTRWISKPLWFQETDYKPHWGQIELHRSVSRFRVMVCGRRWGKSLSAAKEAETMIIQPGTRGWVVSETYTLAEKVIRQIYTDLVMKHKLETTRLRMSGPYLMEFSRNNKVANGSVVEGKSADHPENLLGEGLDWLIFDEFAKSKRKIWEEYLRPTLTDREGWALFIGTPKGYNWGYDLWKRGHDPDHPAWQSWRHPSWENPYLSQEDIEEARRTLDDAVFCQEYGAEFTIMSGQVYRDFNEDIHIIPHRQMDSMIRKEWPRYRACDFGWENPNVCLWITVDPASDRVYIYDEYYRSHTTIEQFANYINGHTPRADKKRNKSHRHQFDYTVVDKSAASARATFLENGIVTVTTRADILHGLEKVREQLKVRPDGDAGLFVSSRCVNTIKEFNLYAYPDVGHSGPKDVPKKENDHAMDAVRYFIVLWRRGHLKIYQPERT